MWRGICPAHLVMFHESISIAADVIEVVGVAIIVIALAHATGLYLFRIGRNVGTAYDRFKVYIGKGLLLGLEFLVAADVVRTVVLEPTLDNITMLGLLVLVRTFLSWSIVIEIEGRWPWQAGREGE
jgi:uncharacterized membrane protein